MSVFVLYHPRSGPTGRALRDALGVPGGTRTRRDPDIILRWGSQREPERRGVQSARAIALASDKLHALDTMRGAGVPTPDYWTGSSLQERPGSGIVLGRNRRGAGGTDIAVYTPDQVYPYHEFYTNYIPNDREYRLHVFNGEVIRTQRKYLEVPEDRTSEYIKNYANGYRFKAPQRELNTSRKEAAINAVAALGLVFGAVDLLVDHDGAEWVLEVNTAPKCSPLTLDAYVSAFKQHLRDQWEVDLG